MSKNIIFDLDGTLTDARPFDYLLDQAPKLWDEWNRKTFEHEIWRGLEAMYRIHYIAGDHIYIITARADNCRLYTENWLRKHDLGHLHHGLYMRAAGDKRPDFIIKEEIIHFLKRQGGIFFDQAYDDRMEVIEMYKRNGINAIHVKDGKISS
jgi:acid phosphatase class B